MALELVKTADGTGLTARNAPAGTAILHQASCTGSGSAGVCKFADHAVGSVLVAADSEHTWVAAEPRDSAGKSLGGWPARQQLSLTPVPPPPAPGSRPLPGVCLNMSPTGLADWQRAHADGCVVGRTDHGSFISNLQYAAQVGMRLCWINHNLSDMGPLVAEYKAQPESMRKALAAVCHGNEQWEGSGVGPKMSGASYGASYVHAAGQWATAGMNALGIPLLMQVRLVPEPTSLPWMNSLVGTLELAGAVKPNGLDTHNYMGRWTSPQRNPTALTDLSDTDGKGWGAQRYLKEIDFVCDRLGLANLPIYPTEYGTASAPHVPDSVGSASEVANHIAAVGAHGLAIGKGEVKTPKGRVVSMPFFTYYDMYAWNLSGAESYGFRSANLGPREEGGIHAAWVAAAKSLTS